MFRTVFNTCFCWHLQHNLFWGTYWHWLCAYNKKINGQRLPSFLLHLLIILENIFSMRIDIVDSKCQIYRLDPNFCDNSDTDWSLFPWPWTISPYYTALCLWIQDLTEPGARPQYLTENKKHWNFISCLRKGTGTYILGDPFPEGFYDFHHWAL